MFLKKILSAIWDFVEVLVFSGAIFLVLYLLILQPHKIKGSSMEPSFYDKEYLLTDKVSYKLGEPKRGDVIVFKAPNTDDEEFIKRIIALPGETILIKDGKVYINGRLVDESYIVKGTYTSGGAMVKEGFELTLPPGKYFVMGDNRLYSSDSRTWGPITKDDITGRAWIIYWPFSKLGTVKEVKYASDFSF